MTPQEYISSGILESYALGSASPAEMQDVETMVSKFPEVKRALDEILTDVEAYATLHAVEPDSALREKILGAIASGKTSSEKSSKNFTANARLNDEAGNGKVIPLQPAKSNSWKNFAAAASVLLALSIGMNIYLAKNSGSKDDQIAAVNDSLKLLADAKQKALIENGNLLQQLDMLRDPAWQSIALNSMIDGHPMKAVVHWDMETMKVAVDPMTLPATTENQKYVLWAIVDGKPINEGDFEMAENPKIQMLNTVPKADSFAISLEKTGNVQSPAGPIYVAGKPSPSTP